ncbi:hypothetical protein [Fusobacterium polymorphum]|uniref:Uncharacterized protein n=1 Tax=Fusobacterium nucleatum subsp. polymorphum TaxID=76857 RepID=A0A2C6A4I5_FUSNP|nr:hypothetical protein [Fusobacterium polymorphum]PHI06620.1 hypothetical protein CBG54_06015 [Fusobacterium polymorphum]
MYLIVYLNFKNKNINYKLSNDSEKNNSNTIEGIYFNENNLEEVLNVIKKIEICSFNLAKEFFIQNSLISEKIKMKLKLYSNL